MTNSPLPAIRDALMALNLQDADYGPAQISVQADLPIHVVMANIRRAGWTEMGHQFSVMGFYEIK
jgi:hypothetical protein